MGKHVSRFSRRQCARTVSMDGLILQDWTTIGALGTSLVPYITQPDADWLDMTPYQDVFFYLDVRHYSLTAASPVLLAYETSPLPDDGYFKAMTTAIMIGGPTITYSPAPLATASVGVARWLRWRLNAS